MDRKRFLPSLGLVLCACGAPPPETGARREQPLRSAVLQEDLILRLRLPPGYEREPSRRYPVVLQLDPTFGGLRQLDHTAGIVSDLEARGAAETLVVGIDYAGPSQRFRDYDTPKAPEPGYGQEAADRFYRALRDEIIPAIDQSLRTSAERRYLFGHSLGGVFALYAAFRHDPAAPPLFAGIVANDAGINQELFTYEGYHAARSRSLPLRLYRAYATYNGWQQELTQRWMTERLAGRGYQGLRSEVRAYETDHGGVIAPGYADGAAFVLGGAP